MAQERANDAVALATEAVRLIGEDVRFLGAALHALAAAQAASGAIAETASYWDFVARVTITAPALRSRRDATMAATCSAVFPGP